MVRTIRVISLLVAFLVGGTADVRAVNLSDIPNPRPNGWAVDLTGRIPPDTLGEINRLGDEVKARRGEIAVAVVDRIAEVNTRGFATRLFNRWGIGRQGINDGVLIFVSLDDHRAEIILGSGIDDPQRRRTSEEILRSEMVPRFRQGDPAGALLAGTQECARRILDVRLAAQKPAILPPVQAEPAASGLFGSAPVSSTVTGLFAVLIAFGLFLHFTRRAPARWPDRSSPVRSARRSQDDAFAASAFVASDAHAHAAPASDSGFGGGHSDGGGASGHW